VIVREAQNSLLLVRQADHGMLSGLLAAAWGTPPWEVPAPREPAIVGARLHDYAWVPFDEQLPTGAGGRPYAFTEVSRAILAPLYVRGADGVEAIDPYAGLLVSLHYSGFYVSHWGWQHWGRPARRLEGEERAAVDGLLEHEKARQRRLRDRLGIAEREDARLRCNYLWLQLWDRVSLEVCRQGFHGWEADLDAVPVSARPGAAEVSLHVRLEPGGICRLDPYPLLPNPYFARVPAVRVPRGAGAAALRSAWLAGGGDLVEVTFRPL